MIAARLPLRKAPDADALDSHALLSGRHRSSDPVRCDSARSPLAAADRPTEPRLLGAWPRPTRRDAGAVRVASRFVYQSAAVASAGGADRLTRSGGDLRRPVSGPGHR